MKDLKAIMLALALVFVFGTVDAFGSTKGDGRLTRDYALSAYLNALTKGEIKLLDEVVHQTTRFCIRQKETMVSYSKTEMINYLENLKNIKQICTTTATTIEDNNEVAVIRVDMRYPGFVRSNYLTITHIGSNWKITNVCSVFK